MIKYTVRYWQLGSRRKYNLVTVIGDGIFADTESRFFIFEDNSRMEIPYKGTVFVFSKERWDLIKDRMDKEAGQDVKIEKG